MTSMDDLDLSEFFNVTEEQSADVRFFGTDYQDGTNPNNCSAGGEDQDGGDGGGAAGVTNQNNNNPMMQMMEEDIDQLLAGLNNIEPEETPDELLQRCAEMLPLLTTPAKLYENEHGEMVFTTGKGARFPCDVTKQNVEEVDKAQLEAMNAAIDIVKCTEEQEVSTVMDDPFTRCNWVRLNETSYTTYDLKMMCVQLDPNRSKTWLTPLLKDAEYEYETSDMGTALDAHCKRGDACMYKLYHSPQVGAPGPVMLSELLCKLLCKARQLLGDSRAKLHGLIHVLREILKHQPVPVCVVCALTEQTRNMIDVVSEQVYTTEDEALRSACFFNLKDYAQIKGGGVSSHAEVDCFSDILNINGAQYLQVDDALDMLSKYTVVWNQDAKMWMVLDPPPPVQSTA